MNKKLPAITFPDPQEPLRFIHIPCCFSNPLATNVTLGYKFNSVPIFDKTWVAALRINDPDGYCQGRGYYPWPKKKKERKFNIESLTDGYCQKDHYESLAWEIN
jgi:hypothetical protein